MDELEALISQKIIDTAKAYGGCTKCYGKGYATWRHGETYRGSTHNMRDDIKLCDCPRGKQLEAVMSQKIIEAHLDEADWFIDVRGKALANGSYPDHAVIDKHYKELQRTLTTKQDTKASNIIDHGDSVEIVIHEVKS
jgi:predicted NBD/HSP70 family sugar kinase